jgi:hypothetical protein
MPDRNKLASCLFSQSRHLTALFFRARSILPIALMTSV